MVQHHHHHHREYIYAMLSSGREFVILWIGWMRIYVPKPNIHYPSHNYLCNTQSFIPSSLSLSLSLSLPKVLGFLYWKEQVWDEHIYLNFILPSESFHTLGCIFSLLPPVLLKWVGWWKQSGIFWTDQRVW